MLDVLQPTPPACPPPSSPFISLLAFPCSMLGEAAGPPSPPWCLTPPLLPAGRSEREDAASAFSKPEAMLAFQMKLSAFATARQRGDDVVPFKADK